MSATVAAALIAGLAGVVSGYFATRASRKVTDTEQTTGGRVAIDGARAAREMEAGAWANLQNDYARVVAEFHEFRAEAKAEIEALKADVRTGAERGDRLETELADTKHELGVEKRKVADLTDRLAAAGIALTPDN